MEDTIMRAFDPEVVDAVWATVAHHIPAHVDNHPKGGHRPRIPDRVCFRVIMVRHVTGCSWVDAERLCDNVVSDTTARERYHEWVNADVFDLVAAHAIAALDRVIGLDLEEVAIDGSIHKAPCGGDRTGKSPVDRGKLGHKWSLATDGAGIPIGWALDGANRHDIPLLAPTLEKVRAHNLDLDIDRIHLDKGYDADTVRATLAEFGFTNTVIDRKRKPGDPKAVVGAPTKDGPHTMGLRWPVERTNSWLSNFGQLRRSTDRTIAGRNAQFCLAVTFLIAAKLIDYRNKLNL